MEVSATHNLGQSLEITTNFNKLKSFSVKKTGGNMREVKLNGKLLFKGEVSKGDRSFKQQVELGNGQKMAITVSWEKDVLDVSSVRNNGIKFNIVGNSSSEKGWFAEKGINPVDTKINVDFNYKKMNLNADLVKVVAGKRYGVSVKNNMLQMNM